MIISVIVPIYKCNNEYLVRLIDSFIEQNIEEFMFYFIENGDKYDCENILKKYEKRMKYKYIYTNEKGVSNARNLGLKEVKTDYVTFLDHDDFVTENWASSLLNSIGYDLCLYNYNMLENGEIIPKINHSYQKIKNIDDVLESIINGYYCGFPWNKMYKMDIIKINNIFYEQDVHCSEDLLFLVKYIDYVNDYKISTEYIYTYMINNDSVSHKYDYNTARDAMLVNRFLVNKYCQNENYNYSYKLKKSVKMNYIQSFCLFYRKASKTERKLVKEEFYKEYKENKKIKTKGIKSYLYKHLYLYLISFRVFRIFKGKCR